MSRDFFINIFYESAQVQTLLLSDFCSGLCAQKYYRFGFGSGFTDFKILKIRVRFRFNDLKFKRFRGRILSSSLSLFAIVIGHVHVKSLIWYSMLIAIVKLYRRFVIVHESRRKNIDDFKIVAASC